MTMRSGIALLIGLAAGAYLLGSLGFGVALAPDVFAEGTNDKVTICHFPPGNTDNPQTIEVDPSAVQTHIDEHGDFVGECEEEEEEPAVCSDGVDNDQDGLVDANDPGCEDAEDDDEFNEPEAQTGSITVCKVVASAIGVVGDGTGTTGTFTISGIAVSGHSTVPDSAGLLPETEFTTPLTLNADLLSSEGNDAECVTYDGLALGSYYYSEESVSGDSWSDPLYNDQVSVEAEDLQDFFAYSGELFTEDASDDASRETNSDGHILLAESRPDRKLIVLNTFTGETGSEPACSDGVDNDEDGLVDADDPGCHTDGDPENGDSYDPDDNDETNETNGGGGGPADKPECSDGIDNDTDGDIDIHDRNCHRDQDASNLDSYDPDDDSESGIIFSGGAGVGSGDDGDDDGEVLGAETTCGFYLLEFIRLGRNNNPVEVMKLERFLNEYQGENLTVDGFYGPEDFAAVERFQLAYSGEVLAPWVPHGLESAQTATGYVYKTTRRWINMLQCPELQLDVPPLP